MTTFVKRAISGKNFSAIRKRCSNGIGFFQDGTYRYVVMDRRCFRLDVVLRKSKKKTFSETAAQLPWRYRVVVTGNYISGGKTLYAKALAGGVVDPAKVDSVGSVRDDGALALPDAEKKGQYYFYFGRDSKRPPNYRYGFRDIPGSVHEGMGGLGPVIMRNPVTRKRLMYGVGNVYRSSQGKKRIPKNEADWRDCIQRNNDTYAAMNRMAKDLDGLCVVGVSDRHGILIAAVKPHGESGDLNTLRDKLFDAGIEGACFTDGSDSACLAVDRSMIIKPIFYKDRVMEVGFGFYYSGQTI